MVTSCVSFVRARCSARRAAAWRTSLATIAALACVLPSAVCAQAAPAPQSAPAAARPTQADRLAAAQVVSQAVALLNAGRSAEAIPALEKLTQEQPDASQAWFLLGAALHTSGQLDRALVAHTRAATFPDVRASALYNVACVHALQGRTNEAIATLKTALADPNGPQLRAQMLADSDLQSLRGDPRWLELVAPAAAGKPFREDVKVLHVWHGGSAGEQFGWEAVDAGDVDGDGVHDVLASAPFHRAATSTAAAGAAGASGAGATSGAGPNGRVTMHSGRSGAVLWARVGEPGEQLGLGISAAGDVDGDGQADVIVGAPAPRATAASSGADAPAGRAYVLSGKDGALLATLQPPVGAGGGSPAGDSFGNQVRGLGDVDGDGHDDVAVSAPFHDGASGGAPDAGRVCVFSGKSGALLFALDGEREGDHFGTALGGATWPAASGAVGAREGLLLVGAMDAGEGQRGRVSVFRLLAGQAQAHFAIEAEPSGSNLGQFFASVVGDLDADGVPDVYATDFGDAALPGSTRGAAGRIVLHSGKDGRRLATIAGHSPGEGFGIGNAQAGDVNGDGVPDLIVGAWTNSDGAQRAGKAYVISGKDRATLATFTGALPGDEFGFDATGLGDVDGDGAPDFLVTAASSNDGGPKAGRVYVLSGAGIAAARASR